jgi:lipoic acid synthetase
VTTRLHPSLGRKPAWLKTRAADAGRSRATGRLLEELGVETVCREARCPNLAECHACGTATFLILGTTCTRTCRFCAIGQRGAQDATGSAGKPEATALQPADPDEPRRIAEAVARLGLRHAVVTSVTRDDLRDGGAAQFAATVREVRRRSPETSLEVLIPDLSGDHDALRDVLAARPDVLAHNLETVPRLSPRIRPQASYERSLALLARSAEWARAAQRTHGSGTAGLRKPLIKTGLMVGLGEHGDEIDAVLRDCVSVGVDAVTVGQYLQPRRECVAVERYLPPHEFVTLARQGRALGIAMRCGPLVRSSYRAAELL